MANRLARASSPYLRQHADNPVDWFEWGEEAFARARQEDKPIFLSVGYASCHWCHVMAHESFEDPEIAEALNEGFVPIKVDREERPDVDAVYMSAVQALTGHGGWPMSAFLTPEGKPFFAGTYWPKDDWRGMPGFARVLTSVRQAWTDQRDDVERSADQLADAVQRSEQLIAGAEAAEGAHAEAAAAAAVGAWDDTKGGFGDAPKFPQAMLIDFLLAHHLRTGDEQARAAAHHSLEAMARGGIYDHVGGGFARYSVDSDWLVPHFEKMLYDNALLLRAYTHGWQVTGDRRFARVVEETATYLLGEMQQPRGGFSSSTDADSEGVEGRFFTWPADELRAVVAQAGEDPDRWTAFFGVTDGGNFEGRNVLHEPTPRDEDDPATHEAYQRVRTALHRARAERVPPALDDKVLTSWNGLVIAALAEAGATFGRPEWVAAARRAAEFIAEELVVEGALHHAWREGHAAAVPALAEDIALLARGLLVLYEADFDPRWVRWARALAADADARFAERGDDGALSGRYFATAEDAEELLTRPAEQFDNAVPSASSVMAEVHLRLHGLTGESQHATAAEAVLARLAPLGERAPTGFGEVLLALERWLAGPREIAVVGAAGAEDLLAVVRERWRPGAVLAWASGDEAAAQAADDVPLLAHRTAAQGRATAYVCQGFACEAPVSEPDALRAQLEA